MKASFADTAYFLALLNAKDEMHDDAVELTRTLEGRIITRPVPKLGRDSHVTSSLAFG